MDMSFLLEPFLFGFWLLGFVGFGLSFLCVFFWGGVCMFACEVFICLVHWFGFLWGFGLGFWVSFSLKCLGFLQSYL